MSEDEEGGTDENDGEKEKGEEDWLIPLWWLSQKEGGICALRQWNKEYSWMGDQLENIWRTGKAKNK